MQISSDSMELSEAKVCRLCFSSQNLFEIFNDDDLNVAEIISEHIGQVKFRI